MFRWLLVLFLGLFLGFQGVRFYEVYEVCLKTQMENELLLQNPICADPWKRVLHGPKQEQVCQHATQENRIHPLACAWKHTWSEGGVNQLWVRVTESYWLLFGVIASSFCTAIIMFFTSWNHGSTLKANKEMQKEMLGTMAKLMISSSSEIPRKEKRSRKKIYHLVAEPSYSYRERERETPKLELLDI